MTQEKTPPPGETKHNPETKPTNIDQDFIIAQQKLRGGTPEEQRWAFVHLILNHFERTENWLQAEIGMFTLLKAETPLGNVITSLRKLLEKNERSLTVEEQYTLSMMAYCGFGGKKDYGKSAKLAELAARHLPEALNHLGNCYMWGHGVKINREKAVRSFESAAERGSVAAYVNLGRYYYKLQDMETAIFWYKKAIENGSTSAKFFLGRLYEKADKVKDIEKALFLYNEAEGQGFPCAQAILGKIYHQGNYGITQDKGKAIELLTKAADQGEKNALRFLSTLYANGNGVNRNLLVASALAMTAAKGSANAEVSVTLVNQCRDCFRDAITVSTGFLNDVRTGMEAYIAGVQIDLQIDPANASYLVRTFIRAINDHGDSTKPFSWQIALAMHAGKEGPSMELPANTSPRTIPRCISNVYLLMQEGVGQYLLNNNRLRTARSSTLDYSGEHLYLPDQTEEQKQNADFVCAFMKEALPHLMRWVFGFQLEHYVAPAQAETLTKVFNDSIQNSVVIAKKLEESTALAPPHPKYALTYHSGNVGMRTHQEVRDAFTKLGEQVVPIELIDLIVRDYLLPRELADDLQQAKFLFTGDQADALCNVTSNINKGTFFVTFGAPPPKFEGQPSWKEKITKIPQQMQNWSQRPEQAKKCRDDFYQANKDELESKESNITVNPKVGDPVRGYSVQITTVDPQSYRAIEDNLSFAEGYCKWKEDEKQKKSEVGH